MCLKLKKKKKKVKLLYTLSHLTYQTSNLKNSFKGCIKCQPVQPGKHEIEIRFLLMLHHAIMLHATTFFQYHSTTIWEDWQVRKTSTFLPCNGTSYNINCKWKYCLKNVIILLVLSVVTFYFFFNLCFLLVLAFVFWFIKEVSLKLGLLENRGIILLKLGNMAHMLNRCL